MPTYTYQNIGSDGSEGEIFEVDQRMTDPALTEHPESGLPVRRIIVTPPAIGGVWTDGSGQNLSDDHIARKGFTKYVKTGDGTYEKTAGKGPKSISR